MVWTGVLVLSLLAWLWPWVWCDGRCTGGCLWCSCWVSAACDDEHTRGMALLGAAGKMQMRKQGNGFSATMLQPRTCCTVVALDGWTRYGEDVVRKQATEKVTAIKWVACYALSSRTL